MPAKKKPKKVTRVVRKTTLAAFYTNVADRHNLQERLQDLDEELLQAERELWEDVSQYCNKRIRILDDRIGLTKELHDVDNEIQLGGTWEDKDDPNN